MIYVTLTVTLLQTTDLWLYGGIAQWLERWNRDQKVVGLSPRLTQEFSFPLDQLSVPTLISVSVPPPYHHSSTKLKTFTPKEKSALVALKILVILQKIAGAWLHMYPGYVCGATERGMHDCTAQNVRRDGSSFTLHQPCQPYGAL